jgi:PKD repeat protein
VRHIRVYWLTCIFTILCSTASVFATTIVMPTDEQLVAKSPVIIEGTVQSSTPVDRGNRIWTETVVSVDKTIKGSAGQTVTIREIGGAIDNRITKIFGGPEYHAGERVLLFLAPTPRGDYQTVDLFVGKFTQEKMLDGTALWVRHDEAADVALLDSNFQPIHTGNIQRAATQFEEFVGDRVAGRKASRNYGVANPVIDNGSMSDPTNHRVMDNFTLISEPTVYRWFAFDNGGSASWYSYGTQPGYTGGGVNEVQTAMGVWTNYTSAKIRYTYAGSETTSVGMNTTNGRNEVLFNDPFGDISGSWNPATGGVVGLGGFNGVSGSASWTATFTADSTHAQGAYTAYNITEANLTVQDGVSSAAGISSSTLAEICAHEFGHTLGFGHSTDSTALMYPTVTGLGPSLRADDQLAARWLYPNGSASPPPTATVPAAPSGLTATISGSNVVLQWKDNATNETGESIFYSAGNNSWTKVTDVSAGTTTATLTGFGTGKYSFYVASFNSTGTSSPSNTASVTFTGSTALQAAFSVSPSSGVAGQTTFTFGDQSTGSVISRLWQFGDGMTSSAASASHVYAAAGSYTVTLTVSDGSTQSSASHVVSVTAPQAALAASFAYSPQNPNTQQNVTFVDQSTGGVTAWYWDFGDGTASQQQNPVKNYPVAGAYNVMLTVYRNSQSSAVSHMITVANAAPALPPASAAFTFSPTSPKAGDKVTFSDRSTGSPTSWSWSFGDGTTSAAQNPSHVFAAPGAYTVSVTVTNSISSSTTSQVVSVATSAQTYRTLVSVTAQTNGVGGSVWRTELTLFNAGESTNVTLTFIPGAAGAMQSRSLFLAPKQSMTWSNALLDIFGMSSGAGALAIEATSPASTPNLKVSSRTFTNGTAGTYGQSVPDVSDLNQTLYLTALESDASFRTNIGLVNRSNASATATLTLLDANGALVGSTVVTVPPGNFQQAALSSYFPVVSGRSYGVLSMRVISSAANAVSAYASVIDNRTQDPVYIQGTPGTAASSMTIPAVGRAAGGNGTFWRSDVTLFNPTQSPMTVGLRYLAAGADNRGAGASNVLVGAGQTLVLVDVVGRLGISSGTGALELSWNSATPPIATSRTYTTAAGGGTYGQSIDPVAAFGRDQYIPGLRSDANFRTNLGFVNSGDVAVGVSVSLLSAAGQTIASGFVAVPPRSQIQISVAAMFPGLDPGSIGSFTLQAHTDTAPTMFAYGSIIDNTSGDPVFFAGE